MIWFDLHIPVKNLFRHNSHLTRAYSKQMQNFFYNGFKLEKPPKNE